MSDDLRKLDEEIARLRGMVIDKNGNWSVRDYYGAGSGTMEREWLSEFGCCETNTRPPNYSSSWALAGPLLVELAEAGAWDGNAMMDCIANAENPCHVIAASWLAWKRGKA